MARKKLTKDERHAAVILEIKRGDGSPVISREEARGMTAAEIIEMFAKRTQVEHIVPHAITGDNHPSNIQFLTPEDHAPKTKRDVTEIAKTKRIEKEQEAFRSRLLAKAGGDAPEPPAKPSAKLRSRPMPKKPDNVRYDWKLGRFIREAKK